MTRPASKNSARTSKTVCPQGPSFSSTTSNLNRILDRSIHRKYHRSCSVWLRKRGKGCSPLGRGDLLLLLLLMWYLLLYHILQLKLFPFCSPICTFYLMGNYTIEPVEPLDYNPSFYQPMRETVTNRCHNILKPIWPRTTYARDTLKTISVHDSW